MLSPALDADRHLQGHSSSSLGQGPVIQVLVMQALAFVLSVCSTVDASLALTFASSFTTGLSLTYLTFGPMVDIKSALHVLRRASTARRALISIETPFLAGAIVDRHPVEAGGGGVILRGQKSTSKR